RQEAVSAPAAGMPSSRWSDFPLVGAEASRCIPADGSAAAAADTKTTSATPSPSPSVPAGKIVDIFIKTYPGDYVWLEYCIRSLMKYARGFRQIVIVSDELDRLRSALPSLSELCKRPLRVVLHQT